MEVGFDHEYKEKQGEVEHDFGRATDVASVDASRWAYPYIWRDRRRASQGKGQGGEGWVPCFPC